MNIIIPISLSTFPTQQCIFMHVVQQQTILVDHCLFRDVLAIFRYQRIKSWLDIVRTNNTLTIEILHIFDTAQSEHTLDMIVSQEAILRHAVCNKDGNVRNLDTRRTSVRCRDDGETYPSAAAACTRYGIVASSMSKHLNGDPSYQTVGGLTFERI